jgi:citrate lyase subunit beta/citryl-CoA lyase
MMFDQDVCRSLLFVAAGNQRYLDSALRGRADVIQVDLEDAVAPDQKTQAREVVNQNVQQISEARRVAAVRVNNDASMLDADLQAVVQESLAALTIPKVDSADTLIAVDRKVTELENMRGLKPGRIRLIAQIESASGVLNAREIAGATPRLAAMGLGMEDLAAEIGGLVSPDALYFPNMKILYAAREAGVTPIGYLGSITTYNDTEMFQDWIRRARDLGFAGGFCVHPNQVSILNEVLAPDCVVVDSARRLVEAYETSTAQGKGAFAFEGQMVDKPVVDRARRLLARAEKLHK